MKDPKDYMEWTFREDLSVEMTILGKEYIENQPVTFDEIEDIIQDFRVRCRSMVCVIDLAGANLFHLDAPALLNLIQELHTFTEGEKFLKNIEIVNGGWLFRWLYRPFSLVVSRDIRDIIKVV
jgi:hypothetical protein